MRGPGWTARGGYGTVAESGGAGGPQRAARRRGREDPVAGPDFSEIFRRYKEALGQAQSSQGRSVPGGGSTMPKPGLVKFVALAVVVFIVVSGSLVVVGPGQRGVVLNFAASSPTVWGEGVPCKGPLYKQVVTMDVRVQQEQTEAAA